MSTKRTGAIDRTNALTLLILVHKLVHENVNFGESH